MDERAIDTLRPDNMARWLRETAANTRAVATLPWSDQQRRVAPHVAFRLEQAAEMIERLSGALETLLPGLVLDLRYADLDDDKDAMRARIETVEEALAGKGAHSAPPEHS